jgi:hypothetical protein
MEPEKEKITTKCRCGYEFLVPNHDPCPKCGSTIRDYKVELPLETVKASVSLTTQQERTAEKKIVNWPLKIILVIILFGAPFLGLLIADIPGAIIGFLIDLVAWYLEKYAEKRYIEKTIERDHYH